MNAIHPGTAKLRHHAWFYLPAMFHPDDLQAAVLLTSAALTNNQAAHIAFDQAKEDFRGHVPGSYERLKQAIRARKTAVAMLAEASDHQVAVMASYGIGPGWWPLNNGASV